MEEARQLIERLERIDALRREGAPAADLLAEVRGLLVDGERWLAAEKPESVERARGALADCRTSLSAGPEEAVAGPSL
jgi:hypothetical protein